MYNSNINSIIPLLLNRIVFVLVIVFMMNCSKFSKTKDEKIGFKSIIANFLLVILAIIGCITRLKNELVEIQYYIESNFNVIPDIVLFILLIVLSFKVTKNEKDTIFIKIVKNILITSLITSVLHIKFMAYSNSYVLMYSQNEIPMFSILLMQLLIFVLMFEFIKNFKNKKDNIKIVLLILLYGAITFDRIHMINNISLKSNFDIILDTVNDLFINGTAITVYTYIINLLRSSKNANKEIEKTEENLK